jgi:hypothetical protein
LLFQANIELENFRADNKETGKLRILYDQLQHEFAALKVSYESSERIRKQQKDLIHLLQRSNAAVDSSNNSVASSVTSLNYSTSQPVTVPAVIHAQQPLQHHTDRRYSWGGDVGIGGTASTVNQNSSTLQSQPDSYYHGQQQFVTQLMQPQSTLHKPQASTKQTKTKGVKARSGSMSQSSQAMVSSAARSSSHRHRQTNSGQNHNARYSRPSSDMLQFPPENGRVQTNAFPEHQNPSYREQFSQIYRPNSSSSQHLPNSSVRGIPFPVPAEDIESKYRRATAPQKPDSSATRIKSSSKSRAVSSSRVGRISNTSTAVNVLDMSSTSVAPSMHSVHSSASFQPMQHFQDMQTQSVFTGYENHIHPDMPPSSSYSAYPPGAKMRSSGSIYTEAAIANSRQPMVTQPRSMTRSPTPSPSRYHTSHGPADSPGRPRTQESRLHGADNSTHDLHHSFLSASLDRNIPDSMAAGGRPPRHPSNAGSTRRSTSAPPKRK